MTWEPWSGCEEHRFAKLSCYRCTGEALLRMEGRGERFCMRNSEAGEFKYGKEALEIRRQQAKED